jgi:hypothetical protein
MAGIRFRFPGANNLRGRDGDTDARVLPANQPGGTIIPG